MAFTGTAFLTVDCVQHAYEACVLTVHPKDDRSLVVYVRQNGDVELVRTVAGGGDPCVFLDEQHIICWPQLRFHFGTSWEYAAAKRLLTDVERVFALRQLQETLERDFSMPVESLPSFQPSATRPPPVLTSPLPTRGRVTKRDRGSTPAAIDLITYFNKSERCHVCDLTKACMTCPDTQLATAAGKRHRARVHAVCSACLTAKFNLNYEGMRCGAVPFVCPLCRGMCACTRCQARARAEDGEELLPAASSAPSAGKKRAGEGVPMLWTPHGGEAVAAHMAAWGHKYTGDVAMLAARMGLEAVLQPRDMLVMRSESADAAAAVAPVSAATHRRCVICANVESRTQSRKCVVGVHALVPVDSAGAAVHVCAQCADIVIAERLRAEGAGVLYDISDGFEAVCALCACSEGVKLTCCASRACPRAFCEGCLRTLLTPRDIEAMDANDQWMCPCCTRATPTPRVAVRARGHVEAGVAAAGRSATKPPVRPKKAKLADGAEAKSSKWTASKAAALVQLWLQSHSPWSMESPAADAPVTTTDDAATLFALMVAGVRARTNQPTGASDDECFVCRDGGVVVECDFKHGSERCTKVYHQECLGYEVADGVRWRCLRHLCRDCGSAAVAYCRYCSTSYCDACMLKSTDVAGLLESPAARPRDVPPLNLMIMCTTCAYLLENAISAGRLPRDATDTFMASTCATPVTNRLLAPHHDAASVEAQAAQSCTSLLGRSQLASPALQRLPTSAIDIIMGPIIMHGNVGGLLPIGSPSAENDGATPAAALDEGINTGPHLYGELTEDTFLPLV